MNFFIKNDMCKKTFSHEYKTKFWTTILGITIKTIKMSPSNIKNMYNLKSSLILITCTELF